MAQRVLSISLGSEVVKVCEVCLAGKKKVQIFNAIDLVIPEGLCEDGVILNADALASSILEGLKGEGFTSKKLVFTLASKRIASKEAVIPYCKENRIKEIVDINATEYFPIANLEDYTVNYSVIEVVQNEGVKNYRLSVVATPNDIVNGYYDLADAMGMSIVSMDFAGNSSLQLLKLQTASNEVDAVIQMGAENTIVNIMDGPTMVMQRSVPYGRNYLVDAVKAYRIVPDSVADAMLIDEDISSLAHKGVEVADAVRTLFSSINRILEFYSSRYQERPIEHIYMLGDVVYVNGLVDLFNSEWEREVVLIEHLHGIEIRNHKNVSDEIAANYIPNIGAVIAPMNIVRIEEKGAKKQAGMPWWVLILAVVCALAMIGGVLFIYFTSKAENEVIKVQIAAFEDTEDLEGKCLRTEAECNQLRDWFESTKSPNESLVRLLDDLEKVQPQDISITRMNLADGNLKFDGVSSNKPAIAEFIKELKGLSYVENVQIEYITESVEDYSVVEAFTISFTLQYKDPYDTEDDESENAENQTEELPDAVFTIDEMGDDLSDNQHIQVENLLEMDNEEEVDDTDEDISSDDMNINDDESDDDYYEEDDEEGDDTEEYTDESSDEFVDEEELPEEDSMPEGGVE